jgi:AcrR family transcriptional regulator
MATGRPLRADAARNRDKLLVAATRSFAEGGLDVPLEEIARRAGVSIGTLYNHFPTRQAFFDAIFPERLAELDRITEGALAEPDPWDGFTRFLEGLFALQAEDQGLNESLARRFPIVSAADQVCQGPLGQLGAVIDRAKAAGRLRPDFEAQDVAVLVWAVSQVIRESQPLAPDAWRRCLSFFLDGLRADTDR